MGNFVHRDTLQRIYSGNDPEWSDPPWLGVPTGSNNEALLDAVPAKHLILTGDVLTEMTQPQKDAVDAAELSVRRDSETARMDELEGFDRAVALTHLQIERITASKFNELLAAIAGASNLATLKASAAVIGDAPTPTNQEFRQAVRDRMGS